MTPSDFRHSERLRVRWAEVDAHKIVFNGHYLTYVDTAVAGYWRSLALDYTTTMAALGGEFYVRKATLEYLRSATCDDLLDIALRCERIGTSSLQFRAAVFRRGELLVSGELVQVYADPHTQTARPVPPALRAVFEAYEAGDAMVEVQVGGWDTLGAAASALRRAVFVDEQKVPAEMEWDAEDARCVHAVAHNRLGVPLATGRLLQDGPGVARIGRMAVALAARGTGVGRAVLDALMNAARGRGDRSTILSAQVSAQRFYQRAGFREQGPVYDEVGIAHVDMVREL